MLYKTRYRVRDKGFTLIEALAVIAIIGLLSAFAIPSYLNYLAKTRVSEMFMLARPAQLGVADAWYGGTTMEEIDSAAAGVVWENNQHDLIDSIAVEGGSVVMVGKADKMQIPKSREGDKIIVRLTPKERNSLISWQCRYADLHYKPFLPKHCDAQNIGVEDNEL